MINPYDEQQGLDFITDCFNLAMRARAPLNANMVIFGLRMQYDAATTMTYPDSRTKHLHEMWDALEAQGYHSPEVPVYVPLSTQPANIRTEDPNEVALRIKFYLTLYGVDTPDNETYWQGIIMDTLYHEGHQVGWTADTYWPDMFEKYYGGN